MNPHRAKYLFSSQQLPRLSLGPLEGFLSFHGALQGPSTLPRALLLELLRWVTPPEASSCGFAKIVDPARFW